mmetsp:Transcript_63730/g.174948  ORF Transcript_63730/g.174948 Transcript_63730/m.174948 type:complete len:211 (+) Transcript_63730:346-978(+)
MADAAITARRSRYGSAAGSEGVGLGLTSCSHVARWERSCASVASGLAMARSRQASSSSVRESVASDVRRSTASSSTSWSRWPAREPRRMGPGSGPESPMSRHPVLSRLPGSGLSASVARALPLRGFLAGGAASRNGCIGTTAPPVPRDVSICIASSRCAAARLALRPLPAASSSSLARSCRVAVARARQRVACRRSAPRSDSNVDGSARG